MIPLIGKKKKYLSRLDDDENDCGEGHGHDQYPGQDRQHEHTQKETTSSFHESIMMISPSWSDIRSNSNDPDGVNQMRRRRKIANGNNNVDSDHDDDSNIVVGLDDADEDDIGRRGQGGVDFFAHSSSNMSFSTLASAPAALASSSKPLDGRSHGRKNNSNGMNFQKDHHSIFNDAATTTTAATSICDSSNSNSSDSFDAIMTSPSGRSANPTASTSSSTRSLRSARTSMSDRNDLSCRSRRTVGSSTIGRSSLFVPPIAPSSREIRKSGVIQHEHRQPHQHSDFGLGDSFDEKHCNDAGLVATDDDDDDDESIGFFSPTTGRQSMSNSDSNNNSKKKVRINKKSSSSSLSSKLVVTTIIPDLLPLSRADDDNTGDHERNEFKFDQDKNDKGLDGGDDDQQISHRASAAEALLHPSFVTASRPTPSHLSGWNHDIFEDDDDVRNDNGAGTFGKIVRASTDNTSNGAGGKANRTASTRRHSSSGSRSSSKHLVTRSIVETKSKRPANKHTSGDHRTKGGRNISGESDDFFEELAIRKDNGRGYDDDFDPAGSTSSFGSAQRRRHSSSSTSNKKKQSTGSNDSRRSKRSGRKIDKFLSEPEIDELIGHCLTPESKDRKTAEEPTKSVALKADSEKTNSFRRLNSSSRSSLSSPRTVVDLIDYDTPPKATNMANCKKKEKTKLSVKPTQCQIKKQNQNDLFGSVDIIHTTYAPPPPATTSGFDDDDFDNDDNAFASPIVHHNKRIPLSPTITGSGSLGKVQDASKKKAASSGPDGRPPRKSMTIGDSKKNRVEFGRSNSHARALNSSLQTFSSYGAANGDSFASPRTVSANPHRPKLNGHYELRRSTMTTMRRKDAKERKSQVLESLSSFV